MSMLAERKVKQKWSLNPRGRDWADDQNKFGQKMLEKMGWSKGKGLGQNLQGITEHLKVKYKNDSKGIGHKDRDDQWTEHEDQFSNLLKSLSAQSDEKIVKIEKTSSSSLVDKSKNSKARIHYNKFTRGKDLTRYSEKDLANVFGRKQLQKEKKVAEEEKEDKGEEDSERFRIGGSMADYFKKKLGNSLGSKNNFSVGKNGVLKKDSESESEERPSFGFGFKNNGDENNDEVGLGFGFTGFKNNDDSEGNDHKDAKSNEKKHLGFGFNKAGFGFNKNTNDIENTNCDSQKGKFGMGFINFKKSASSSENKNNSEYQEENSNENMQNDEWQTKKETKRKNNNDHADLNGETSFVYQDEEKSMSHADLNGDTFLQNGKCSKKKKKKTKDLDSSISVNTSLSEKDKELTNNSILKNDEELNSSISKKCKSSKKQKTWENEDVVSESCVESAKKKKDKKKKSKEGINNSSSFENNCLNVSTKSLGNDEDAVANGEESVTESYRKKNKNRHKGEYVDSPMIKNYCEEDSSINNENVDSAKKRKKKKNQEDTPSFVSYISEDLEAVNPKKRKLEEAEDRTPKKKKKKDSKEVGLSNPAFDPFFNPLTMEKHHLNTINEDDVTNAQIESNFNNVDNVDVGDKKNKKKKDKLVYCNEDVVEDEKAKKKKSKKRKLDEGGVENICFNGLEESHVGGEEVENPYEVKTKKKKSKSKDKNNSLNQTERQPEKSDGIDNPALNLTPPIEEDIQCDLILNTHKGIDNPALNLTPPIEEDIQCDLILNTTTEKRNNLQRRKSVTFSDVNKEHIIPNREQLARQSELFEINTQILEESAKKKKKKNIPEGYDNEAFNALPQRQQEKLRYEERFRYAVDTYELQVENALNERKSLMVGDPNSQLEEGVPHKEGVVLPYKKASFLGVNYGYFSSDIDQAKSGYKHFIRGDILVTFKNSNLHQITGYGIDVTKVVNE